MGSIKVGHWHNHRDKYGVAVMHGCGVVPSVRSPFHQAAPIGAFSDNDMLRNGSYG